MIVPINVLLSENGCLHHIYFMKKKHAETNVLRHEVEGLTRPAMGVWSLLIFFTDPGLIELNNLSHKDREENIWAMADHKERWGRVI